MQVEVPLQTAGVLEWGSIWWFIDYSIADVQCDVFKVNVGIALGKLAEDVDSKEELKTRRLVWKAEKKFLGEGLRWHSSGLQ